MNKSVIFVGDPHVQVSNLEDSEKVMQLVMSTQESTKAGTLIIAGDLFHTHAVLRIEVINFWRRWAQKLASANFTFTYMLVGNHDMPGDKQKEGQMSALDVLSDFSHVRVISSPFVDENERGFLPYYSDHDEFIKNANLVFEAGARTLFCHQTFDGSQYENGFYAPGGIKIEDLPNFDSIVSGHIHKTQKIGKVFYPGTPKWDSLSDANEEKGIWTFVDGVWSLVSSASVIEPIRVIKLQEPQMPDKSIKISPRTIVELHGSSSWIASTSKKLKGKCRLVARPSDRAVRKAKEKRSSDIFQYLDNLQIPNQNKVKAYLEELCQ